MSWSSSDFGINLGALLNFSNLLKCSYLFETAIRHSTVLQLDQNNVLKAVSAQNNVLKAVSAQNSILKAVSAQNNVLKAVSALNNVHKVVISFIPLHVLLIRPRILFALLVILLTWAFHDNLLLVNRPRSENSEVSSRMWLFILKSEWRGNFFMVIRISLHF